MTEEWKDIPGYEGRYQINNQGEIRSLDRYRLGKGGAKTFCKGRIMVQSKAKNGYMTVGLSDSKKYKLWLVHRLIAITFLENPLLLPCVDHINGNRRDNCVDNLRWCSHRQNLNYELAKSHISSSNKASVKCKQHIENLHHKCKKPIIIVYPNGKVVEYDSISDAEKDGFNHSLISAVCKGKQKTHRKCRCYYKDDYYID